MSYCDMFRCDMTKDMSHLRHQVVDGGRAVMTRRDMAVLHGTTILSIALGTFGCRDMGYDATRRSVRGSLDRLGLDCIDVHLIHWPIPRLDRYVETYQALVDARDDGEIRSVGVSNFNADHLERIIDATGVMPAINQIELHPRFPQEPARALHRHLGIQTQCWSPLGLGDRTPWKRDPSSTRHAATR